MVVGGDEDARAKVQALDRILTRLALTDEAQLEKVLAKLLPAVISHMGEAQPVVNKVVETLPLEPSEASVVDPLHDRHARPD